MAVSDVVAMDHVLEMMDRIATEMTPPKDDVFGKSTRLVVVRWIDELETVLAMQPTQSSPDGFRPLLFGMISTYEQWLGLAQNQQWKEGCQSLLDDLRALP